MKLEEAASKASKSTKLIEEAFPSLSAALRELEKAFA